MEFKRNCPSCNKKLVYKHEHTLKKANSENRTCASCSAKNRNLERDNYQFKRNCPICNKEIKYKSEAKRNESKLENKKCQSCAASKALVETNKKMGREIREGKRKAPGTGTNLYARWLEKYGKEEADKLKEEYSQTLSNSFRGSGNAMYGKTVYGQWVKKYGKEEADRLKEERRKKRSKSLSGKNNPMYGKPSPQGSGNGWSGWYKGWYFRSFLELSFMIKVIERFNFKWDKGESISIPYIKYNGIKSTYRPDFILNRKYIIECKPKKLWNSKEVKLKRIAAEEYCKDKGLIYKMFDIKTLDIDEIKSLYENKEIILLDKYDKKFKNKFYECN